MSDPAEPQSVDEFCALLRQGDVSLTPCVLVVQKGNLGSAAQTGTHEAEGVVITTQTCDLVGPSATEPYVQVSPLFTVADDERKRRWLESGHVPQFVAIPGLDGMFADLTITVTVEKEALLGNLWTRPIANHHDAELFAQALGRKSSRFAFPDDFQAATKKLRDRIRNKYGKSDSAEGRVLQRVRQVRATATPSWSHHDLRATLIFVLDPAEFPIGSDLETADDDVALWISDASIAELCTAIEDPAQSLARPLLWEAVTHAWAALCKPVGIVTLVDAEAVTADEFSAADMWATQRLDVDYLSDDDPQEPGL